jgi:hypothetical protein
MTTDGYNMAPPFDFVGKDQQIFTFEQEEI